MVVGTFLVSSKKLKFFLLKKRSWTDYIFFNNYISVGHFQPI